MFSIQKTIPRHLYRPYNFLFYLSNCKFNSYLHYLCLPANIKLLKCKSSKSLQVNRYDECSSSQSWNYSQSSCQILIKSVGRKGTKSTNVCISDSSLQLLCNTFGFEIEECRRLAHFQAFLNCSDNQLSATIEFLHEIGIRAQHISKAPWLLLITKEKLEKRVALLLLPNLFKNVMDGVGFLLYNPLLLKKYDEKFSSETDKFPHHRNRIYYITDHLKLNLSLFSLKIVQVWKIMHQSKENLDATIDVLSEFKVNPESIINDLWIFSYGLEKMKKRFQLLQEENGNPGKPWVGRCPETTYQSHSFFQKGYKFNIPYGNIPMLLKEELDIDFVPSFLRKRTPHSIFHNITILRKNGFEKDVLRGNLKLLHFCPSKILTRKQILLANGVRVYMPALTFTENKFEKFIKQIQNSGSLK